MKRAETGKNMTGNILTGKIRMIALLAALLVSLLVSVTAFAGTASETINLKEGAKTSMTVSGAGSGWKAVSDNKSVVRVSKSGSTITLKAVNCGTANVNIKKNGRVLASYEVNVTSRSGMAASLLKSKAGYVITTASGTKTVKGSFDEDFAEEIRREVNEYRESCGLDALGRDKNLAETAMIRAAEISVLFEHTRPDGTPFYSIYTHHIHENLACRFSSATSLVRAWQGSASHQANLQSTKATTLEIGVFRKANGDGTYTNYIALAMGN